MAGMGAGYDLSVATFSPDGRVFQVEYACKAVDSSAAALAFICSDGIIIAVERPQVSKLTIPSSAPRIHAIDRHCSICVCGFPADGRQIALRARKEAEQYKRVYGVPIPGRVLAERVALYVHVFTLAWSLRPLGASVLLTVCEENGTAPELYTIEPSGGFNKFFGTAVGKNRQSIKTEIEKLDRTTLTCEAAVFYVAKILREVQEETKKDLVMEVAWHCKSEGYEFQRVPVDILEEAQKKALKFIEDREEL
eukprot:Lankesteria_metandrocarpae@DN5204_c0_g2_i1.p1